MDTFIGDAIGPTTRPLSDHTAYRYWAFEPIDVHGNQVGFVYELQLINYI
jgi:hypothetical protein